MRHLRRLILLALTTALFTAVLAIPAQAGPAGTLLSRINNSRAAAGLAPVETYWDLTDDARAHSARMMDRGEIYHNTNLGAVTGVWLGLGENVGVGWDINELHDGFMSSSGHRANILGNFNYVGIGVKQDDDGAYWVTVIFMRAEPGLNGGSEETTTTTVAPTTTTTPPPADPPPTTSPDPTPSPTTTTTAPPAGDQGSKAVKASSPSSAGAKASSVTAGIVGYSHPVLPIID